jgi:hypothetical protein
MKCPECNRIKDEFARIRIEVIDKKTRNAIDVIYGRAMCLDCLVVKYKTRDKLRIYI